MAVPSSQDSGGVDGGAGFGRGAPLTDRVEIFECETDGVHVAMAGRAHRTLAMFFQALAHGARFRGRPRSRLARRGDVRRWRERRRV